MTMMFNRMNFIEFIYESFNIYTLPHISLRIPSPWGRSGGVTIPAPLP